MLKTLGKYIGQYKKASLLAPIIIILEVLMEIAIPFVMASLIDKGIEARNLKYVIASGILMIVMASLGVLFGVVAGKFAAFASTGFACNLRNGIFEKIQSFSFSNIDKFSTAGLDRKSVV